MRDKAEMVSYQKWHSNSVTTIPLVMTFLVQRHEM